MLKDSKSKLLNKMGVLLPVSHVSPQLIDERLNYSPDLISEEVGHLCVTMNTFPMSSYPNTIATKGVPPTLYVGVLPHFSIAFQEDRGQVPL